MYAKQEPDFSFASTGDSLDWKDPTVDEMYNRVTSKVTNGSIVLFHNGAKNTPAALPKIIEKLQADGYTIVPISDLIMKDNYTIDHAGKQIAKNSAATVSSTAAAQ